MTRYRRGAIRERGAIALEFLFLFPFVMAMLYASAIYGVTFFAKYQMQNAVDRAVAAALYVDRSQVDEKDLGSEVSARALRVLDQLVGKLPDWKGTIEPHCAVEPGTVEMVHCTLTYKGSSDYFIAKRGLSFGMLGEFPPLPDALEVHARTAF